MKFPNGNKEKLMNHSIETWYWTFANLNLPMIKLPDGRLVCTSKAVCRALGINKEALRFLASKYVDKLSRICVSETNANGFLQENRDLYELNYIRGDMRLWTPDDLLWFARHATSAQSDEAYVEIINLVKREARAGLVSIEEWRGMEAQLTELRRENLEMQEWRRRIEVLEDILGVTGSALGKGLQAIGQAKKVH